MGKVVETAVEVVENDQNVGGGAVVSFPPAAAEAGNPKPGGGGGGGGGEAAVSFPPTAAHAAGGASPFQTPIVGNPWSTGLFDCHEDQTNAIMTAICPCVTFGQIAEVLDGGETTSPVATFIYLLLMPVLCSQWIMGSKYRTKLRNKYSLVEAPYQDAFSHIFCSCCSLCQEFRELRNRNLDPSLGLKGILAQQQGVQYGYPQATNPPPVQTMSSTTRF